ncbi:MAG: response regulator transcription factor [Planctomycetes bacterium]|nr:response regulator transcription factor [Planctomycetota bacterium]
MSEILLIEDEPGIREAVTDFLVARGYLVRAASTLAGAHDELARGRPALLVLDLRLPDGDGLELLRAMREGRLPRLPTIIVTARGEEAARVRGLEAGADDYVVKPFSIHELWARIRAVLRRSGEAPTRLLLGAAEIDLDAGLVRRAGEELRLLPKEIELLAFFLRHPGRALGREEILREVWGLEVEVTTRTVDTHVFTLRQKIEAEPARPRHLLTARGRGYRLEPGAD